MKARDDVNSVFRFYSEAMLGENKFWPTTSEHDAELRLPSFLGLWIPQHVHFVEMLF